MRFRIKQKVFLRSDTNEIGDVIITKISRPILQMKLLFFWITIKEFLQYHREDAEEACKQVWTNLTGIAWEKE